MANRDREMPHRIYPPALPGIRITYHGGSLLLYHATSEGSPKVGKVFIRQDLS